MKYVIYVIILILVLWIIVASDFYHSSLNVWRQSSIIPYNSIIPYDTPKNMIDFNPHPFNNIWDDVSKKSAIFLITSTNEVFDKYDIQGFSIFETLLGAVKYNGFIPWNDSISLMVDSNSYTNLIGLKENFERYNLCIVTSENGLVKIHSREKEWPCINIFSYKTDTASDIIIYDVIQSKTYNLGKIYNLYPGIKTKFETTYTIIPNKHVDILNILYEKWQTVCTSSSFNNRTMTGSKVYNVGCSNIINVDDDIFKNVWVINLDRMKDRYSKTKHRLNRIGIYPNRWSAVDANSSYFMSVYKQEIGDKRNPQEVACYLSHYTLWDKLKNDNLNYAIIFEDDIYIPDNIDKDHIKKIIDDSKGFDIIYLGYCYGPSKFKQTEKLSKIGHAMCLHAYVISRDGINKLLDYAKNRHMNAVDQVVSQFCKKDGLCFLAHSIENKFYGDGIIQQDRHSHTSSIPHFSNWIKI